MARLDAHGLTFDILDPIEAWRVKTIDEKEPGTLRWLDTLREGDVLFDVGANIGLYTMLGAQRVGPSGRVLAFEPHVVNAGRLLANVARNAFMDRVSVVTTALGESTDAWSDFHYRSLRAGSSGSQADSMIGEDGQTFTPKVSELKYSTSLDRVSQRVGKEPTHLKIDVDGRELMILRGAYDLLMGSALRALQVELHAVDRNVIVLYLQHCGWRLKEEHHTKGGQLALAAGKTDVTVNGVFER